MRILLVLDLRPRRRPLRCLRRRCREAEQSARRIFWNAFGLYLTLRGRLVQDAERKTKNMGCNAGRCLGPDDTGYPGSGLP